MANSNSDKRSTGLWAWIVIGLIVAAIAVGTLYYIGWFNINTHVDTPAGDNVEQQWQNADGQTLREEIVDPEAPTATPPSPEN